MSIQIERIPLSTRPSTDESVCLNDMLTHHGRVTLVVPNFGVRDVCRRALADTGCGVGIDVTTVSGWICTLWELLGDGRHLVSGTQRTLLMAQALAAYRDAAPSDAAPALSNTPGTINMLVQAARTYLPAIEEHALVAELSAAERQMVAVLKQYGASLQDRSLVEESEAATLLADMVRKSSPACARGVVFRGVHDMPPYLLALVDAVAQTGDVRIVLEQEAMTEALDLARCFDAEEPAGGLKHSAASSAGTKHEADAERMQHETPSIPLRCVEVCGPAARDAAYTQLIVAAAGEGAEETGAVSGGMRAAASDDARGVSPTVVAASPDPLATFQHLAPRLAASGIASTVDVRTPFQSTRAGQTLAMLADLLERIDREEASAWWPAPEIPDWIRSPFSGLVSGAPRIARTLDTRLRKTRNLTKETLLAELESLQSREVNRERELAEREGRARRPVAVKAVIDALDEHQYTQALQLMAACAAAAPVTAFGSAGLAAKQAELAALEAARAFMDEAHGLGVSDDQAFLMLPQLSIRVSAQMAPGDASATSAAGTNQCDGAGGDRDAEANVEDATGIGVTDTTGQSDTRINGSVVPVPYTSAFESSTAVIPAVVFCSVDVLASSAPGRYRAALVLDADAESFPVSERDTPLTLLAEKLDCVGIAANPAERQRIAFRDAAESAQVAVLAYVARDRQAEERYPALAYAEAREAIGAQTEVPVRSDPSTTRMLAALDRAIADLPNEGALFANLDRAGGVGTERTVVTTQGEHVLSPELNRYLLLPERSLGSHTVPRTLSASQIENYLACPYRWLVSNRASTRQLDVGFGPIEMGNFVHDVMQRFHERLIDVGLMRVRPETVDACLEQMSYAFEEMRADHERGKYTHGKYAKEARPRAIRSPLVPLDELERNQLDAMLPKLHEVVRYEADMLSIFMPAQFEYSFDKAGVTYAGHPLGGRIDRIDTAPDAGNGERFVVIDYKNRTSVRDLGCSDPTMTLDEGEELADGWLPGRDADRAPKVQTLIYAQALERLGRGSAQGAVYVATRGPQAAGSVADALVASEPPAFPHDAVSGFPGEKPPRSRAAKHDGTLTFQQLLDTVEEGIARELDALEHGAIAPRPAADSCSFCPLTMCERRRS